VVTVLTDTAVTDGAGRGDADALWLSPAEFASTTGWELKPEGACRDEVCVPLPGALVKQDEIDVAGFWRHTGRPVLRNEAASVWLLAEGAIQRRAMLESSQAPDFTLPDLEGTQHSLSEYRGKKVFLATWASW
jgi:hypothetical protein